MAGPTREFWQERFAAGETPWDRAGPSPQLVAWLGAGELRETVGSASGSPRRTRVGVPGCGSGWEVAELARRGFAVTALDYAPAAVERTRALLGREGLSAAVELADVLSWHPAEPFDAVYEQTCLCALHPDHWVEYAARLRSWLHPGGTLWALFVQAPRPSSREGRVEGPPYHCDVNAMRALFPARHWEWPKPPYGRVPHPQGWDELAVPLTLR
jgi:SAM-dependent methyltransferase